jgi:histidyl-tRNA synthetase
VTAPASEETKNKAFEIANNLRKKNNVRIELDVMNRKLSKVLEYASKINASHVIVVGSKELKEGKVMARNMKENTQNEIPHLAFGLGS